MRDKIFKVQNLILLFTIGYIIIFGFYFIRIGNLEFLWYIGIMILLLILMILAHKKFNFPNGVLAGASIWGLIHMLGGSVKIDGRVLYAYVIYPLFKSGDNWIFRYDQFAHFYCYIFVTLIFFYILKPSLKNNYNKKVLLTVLVLVGVGVGAVNEMVEFIPVLVLERTGVGDYFNTLWDIVFNTIGAITAVVYLYYTKIRGYS